MVILSPLQPCIDDLISFKISLSSASFSIAVNKPLIIVLRFQERPIDAIASIFSSVSGSILTLSCFKFSIVVYVLVIVVPDVSFDCDHRLGCFHIDGEVVQGVGLHSYGYQFSE